MSWWGSEVRVSCSFQIISGRGGKCNLRGGISPSRNAVVMVHPGPDPDKTWPPPSYCHYNDTPPAPAFLHAASNHVLFWGGWPTFGGSTVWLQVYRTVPARTIGERDENGSFCDIKRSLNVKRLLVGICDDVSYRPRWVVKVKFHYTDFSKVSRNRAQLNSTPAFTRLWETDEPPSNLVFRAGQYG